MVFIVLFIYDIATKIFMKITNKKTISDEFKKVRIEKKTDKEFPPAKGIHKQPELPQKSNKQKSHKAIK